MSSNSQLEMKLRIIWYNYRKYTSTPRLQTGFFLFLETVTAETDLWRKVFTKGSPLLFIVETNYQFCIDLIEENFGSSDYQSIDQSIIFLYIYIYYCYTLLLMVLAHKRIQFYCMWVVYFQALTLLQSLQSGIKVKGRGGKSTGKSVDTCVKKNIMVKIKVQVLKCT